MSNLTLDINATCNEACRFCYQELDDSVLPVEDIFKIVGESPAVKTVEIGGGEPFLDKRIIDIIKGIRKQGKNVHIATNASMIPNGLFDLEEKVRSGVQIQVSLHASNPELYATVHGRDLFENVIRNIGKIKNKFSTLVSSAIYGENFGDVENIVGLVHTMGLPLRVNLVFPMGKGKDVELLTPLQIDQLRGYLLAQKLIKDEMIDSPLIHNNNCDALEDAYSLGKSGPCPFDCGKVYVTPKGERFGCEFYRKPIRLNVEKRR